MDTVNDEKHEDHFTRLMFSGKGTHFKEKIIDDHEKQKPSFGDFMAHVNYDELMKNVEILMDSVESFKPLFKKITPIVEKFLKQK
ncbi:hypothetical protein H1Z61_04705 [Bacillus aquiflavi]|uniref:Uncharacterized protein n=1 Tax=Bacillus aquiflavi TaxID=2672567 RepID=A0A6B3VYX9_9BACI|nr:hypothetical protein [Bacillus aquiflavi]MBA4536463.1 hypothetical protein [Bacillus aquiflavi]NEY80831.1 hypothetical protein [Bacillus aquiflavi]UAC49078.1 hypothetical protein K6959_04045 [Bacillus aquiflavi]